MFSDQLFLRRLPKILRVLAMLPASAVNFQDQCQITIRLTPVSLAPSLYELFYTLRNYGVRSLHAFISDATATDKNRDLFSPGRYVPANGKESIPC